MNLLFFWWLMVKLIFKLYVFLKTLNIFIALSNLIRGHNTQFFHIESVALQRDIVLYSIYQIHFSSVSIWLWLWEIIDLIWFIVLNATFWRPVLLVEEAGVPDHGQATGNLYHLLLRVECTFFVIYKAGCEPTPYWWSETDLEGACGACAPPKIRKAYIIQR